MSVRAFCLILVLAVFGLAVADTLVVLVEVRPAVLAVPEPAFWAATLPVTPVAADRAGMFKFGAAVAVGARVDSVSHGRYARATMSFLDWLLAERRPLLCQ